jgi:uncharacterized protein with HEPN domain
MQGRCGDGKGFEEENQRVRPERSGASMRDDRERLKDILEAMERIETYSAKGRAAFEQDELIQVWFLRYLQIIGEASRALSSNIRETHPEVPWAKIIGMRI